MPKATITIFNSQVLNEESQLSYSWQVHNIEIKTNEIRSHFTHFG